MRIEKISALVLHEIHERQVEEVMETLSEGPGGSTDKRFLSAAISYPNAAGRIL